METKIQELIKKYQREINRVEKISRNFDWDIYNDMDDVTYHQDWYLGISKILKEVN